MKGTENSNPDRHFLQSWIVSASVWGILSCFLLAEYKKQGDLQYLTDLFLLLSFLWAQFGFAAIFNAVYKQRFERISAYAAVTILPPLIVYLLVIW